MVRSHYGFFRRKKRCCGAGSATSTWCRPSCGVSGRRRVCPRTGSQAGAFFKDPTGGNERPFHRESDARRGACLTSIGVGTSAITKWATSERFTSPMLKVWLLLVPTTSPLSVQFTKRYPGAGVACTVTSEFGRIGTIAPGGSGFRGLRQRCPPSRTAAAPRRLPRSVRT